MAIFSAPWGAFSSASRISSSRSEVHSMVSPTSMSGVMNRASFSLAQGITSGSRLGGTKAEKSTASTAAHRAATCSAVVPQQPPKIRTPAAAKPAA